MIDESARVLSPSWNAGMRPSGLIFLNSAVGGKGEVCSCSNGKFFSAKTTFTLRTNGDTLAPNNFNINISPWEIRARTAPKFHRETVTIRGPDATANLL